MAIYAHSVEGDPDRSRWETLSEHIERVTAFAVENAAAFGAENLAAVVSALHDYGKLDPRFQARLDGGTKPFDHAAPGALLARQTFGPAVGEILALVIAGHHTGLMDSQRSYQEADKAAHAIAITPLDERLEGKDEDLERQKRIAEKEGLKSPVISKRLDLRPRVKRRQKDLDARGFGVAFFVRMLFSALVDADRLATEGFSRSVGEAGPERGSEISLGALKAALDAHLAAISAEAARDKPGIVTEARAAVLAAVRRGANAAPGVFTLCVPTGGGKTLASLAFALDHALAQEKPLRRVITVIPFTSIVEQTAAVFRTALGKELGAGVLEHHGAFDETKLGPDRQPEMADKLRLDQQNWDAPVVVTTSVQFFESLFANRTSRCRKLHNIASSVIILDEVQTLPLGLLRPAVLALDELARNYGCTILLCTATQPAILDDGAEGKEDDEETTFLGGLRDVRHLIAAPETLFETLKRVEVRFVGARDDEALAARILGTEQSLTIVNTRKAARSLFERIEEAPGARHLSTMMCAAHRSQVLAEIRADLEAGRPVRLVSTSLIEAGVDISFPLVQRAAAGLDQIAQAAGRCNREGKPGFIGEAEVFEPETNHPEMCQRFDATKAVLRLHEGGRLQGSLLDPPAITAYFRELFFLKGPEVLDKQNILALTEGSLGRHRFSFPMESIALRFRMIEDMMVPVIIPWNGEARALLEALPHAPSIGGIARKLQRYIVAIPLRDRNALIAKGAAAMIDEQRFSDQFVELRSMSLYRDDVGLDASDPLFMSTNEQII